MYLYLPRQALIIPLVRQNYVDLNSFTCINVTREYRIAGIIIQFYYGLFCLTN